MEDPADFVSEGNVQDIVNTNQKLAPYSVGPIQGHVHNGVDANRVSVGDLIGYYNSIVTYTPVISGTARINLSVSSINHITMPAGNITIAIVSPRIGQFFTVRILQDSVGSRTVTWFTTIRWAGGVAPTLTTTANKADTMVFQVTGLNTYDGFVAGQNI